MADDARVEVALEVTERRTFAVAARWPGWARSGRDEDAALASLVAAGPRYAAAISRADGTLRPPADPGGLVVVARLPGTATTAFGAPDLPLPGDDDPLEDAELERAAGILAAAWWAFDAAVERHAGDTLATGPRGGGRSVAKIVEHVAGADGAYLVQLGARRPKLPDDADPVAAVRAAAMATLRARARGLEIPDPSQARSPWTPRFYVRRAAWHALDHAWEIEDRAAAARA
jgi:hypothetical protein